MTSAPHGLNALLQLAAHLRDHHGLEPVVTLQRLVVGATVFSTQPSGSGPVTILLDGHPITTTRNPHWEETAAERLRALLRATAPELELNWSVHAAGQALVTLYRLMEKHGVRTTADLRLLVTWPPGLKTAYSVWMAGMGDVVKALVQVEGPAGAELTRDQLVHLTERAYDLVLHSPAGGDIRPRLAAITGVLL